MVLKSVEDRDIFRDWNGKACSSSLQKQSEIPEMNFFQNI